MFRFLKSYAIRVFSFLIILNVFNVAADNTNLHEDIKKVFLDLKVSDLSEIDSYDYLSAAWYLNLNQYDEEIFSLVKKLNDEDTYFDVVSADIVSSTIGTDNITFNLDNINYNKSNIHSLVNYATNILKMFVNNFEKLSPEFRMEAIKFLIPFSSSIFGMAIFHKLPIEQIKIFIDFGFVLDLNILEIIYSKEESLSVYEMQLFSYFTSLISRHSLIPNISKQLITDWNENKDYLEQIFDYMCSIRHYKDVASS